MVEGARLEIVWAAMSRRFESSRFRQEVKKTRKGIFYFFEEEKRIRAQGSHGAIVTSPHPLASATKLMMTHFGLFFMRIYEVFMRFYFRDALILFATLTSEDGGKSF